MEVIGFKCVLEGKALISSAGYPYEKTTHHNSHSHICTEETPCDNTASGWPFASQEESPHQKQSANTSVLDF